MDGSGERKGKDGGWCDVRMNVNVCAEMRKYG